MSALTADQRRAADLLGRAVPKGEVAEEVGVTPRTLRKWQARDDFKALVKQTRDKVLEENPTAKSVLEAALSATTKSGAPSWQVRLKAAELLMRDPSKVPGAVNGTTVERVYVSEDE